jgi:hypothetical protein
MYYPRKLRNDFRITGFIPAIICISIGALIWLFIGRREGYLSVSIFIILYSWFSFWIYLRTRNQSYLAASTWQFLSGIYIATSLGYPVIKGVDPKISGLLIFLFLSSTVWLFYLVFTRRAKWKGREVFELASLSIEPQPDGFTERPHPAGKAEYTRSELTGFAQFLRKNLIAMPYFEENRIVFVPVKMEEEFSYIFNPEKFKESRSWIAFDFQGNVTVNVSKRDYIGYKEELSFDQICDNLGKLFIEFMKYYRKGEAERILYKLNELGLGLTY